MPKPSLRDRIVASGVETLRRYGFASAGVRDVTREAGVPQGCFTNHFRSKEIFGSVVLERYCAKIAETMSATVLNSDLAPKDRIVAYFDIISQRFEAEEWRYGCLIGNMSLETAEGSEILRQQLRDIHAAQARSFVTAIRAAQECGAFREDVSAEDLADFMLASWHGAIMRMKVDRDKSALDRFQRTILATFRVESAP